MSDLYLGYEIEFMNISDNGIVGVSNEWEEMSYCIKNKQEAQQIVEHLTKVFNLDDEGDL